MATNKNDLLNITPLENYKAPKIPTLSDDNTAQLKKLPSRWQKNAKIIACAGLIGVLTLPGVAFGLSWTPSRRLENDMTIMQVSHRGYSDAEVAIRFHVGGAGMGSYIVHLTEQEAFGIIQARLEAAGLNFDAPPPGYTVGHWVWDGFGLDLFDAQKSVAIAHLSWEDSNLPFTSRGRAFAASIENAFAEQVNDITVGAFYNPGRRIPHIHMANNQWIRNAVSRRDAAESLPILKGSLNLQIDMFIASLQIQGILEPTHQVNVVIDGVLTSFNTLPVIVNGHVMVSAHELFRALGLRMEMIWGDSRSIRAIGTDLSITVSAADHVRHRMLVNGAEVEMATPAFQFGNMVLASLQCIAEATGATVEWDENTHTMNITTGG